MTRDGKPSEAQSEVRHLAAAVLVELGAAQLERQRIRARKYREKLLVMPLYWHRSRQIQRVGKAISRLDPEPETDLARAIIETMMPRRLPWSAKFDMLRAILDSVSTSGHASFGAALLQAIEPYKVEFPDNVNFFFAEAFGQLEDAAMYGRRLDAPETKPSVRARFRKTRTASLLARDLVPPPQPSPDWAVQGRLAYMAASSIPFSTAGYATRTHGVARAYRRIGFDLDVVTRPPFPLNRFENPLKGPRVPSYETIDGVPYHRLFKPVELSIDRLRFLTEASDAVEAKLKELAPEHVIAASNYVNALPALVAARRLGLPFAYEVRGFWEMTRASSLPGFEGSTEFQVMVAMEAFVATQADRVLTLTEPMVEELVRRGVSRERIALMPNGVDEELVQSLDRDAALAAQLGVPAEVPVIGYAGSILDYEGLDLLAEACVALAGEGLDFRLLIVGAEKTSKGAQSVTGRIRASFDGAGIPDKLLMPGRVPFHEVPRYYSLMDICPIPRRSFAVTEVVSPIKPAEAMAMGKAVVVSSVSALAAFAQDGRTARVFEKDNVAELTAVLRSLVTDRNQVRELGAAGQAFIRRSRTWPVICRTAAGHLGLEV